MENELVTLKRRDCLHYTGQKKLQNVNLQADFWPKYFHAAPTHITTPIFMTNETYLPEALVE